MECLKCGHDCHSGEEQCPVLPPCKCVKCGCDGCVEEAKA